MLLRLMLRSELPTRADPGNMVKRGHSRWWSLRQTGFRAPSSLWRNLVARVNWGGCRAGCAHARSSPAGAHGFICTASPSCLGCGASTGFLGDQACGSAGARSRVRLPPLLACRCSRLHLCHRLSRLLVSLEPSETPAAPAPAIGLPVLTAASVPPPASAPMPVEVSSDSKKIESVSVEDGWGQQIHRRWPPPPQTPPHPPRAPQRRLQSEIMAFRSTGGKQKLGPISKRGDRYLRRILVVRACAVLRYARHKPEKYPWLTSSRPQTVQGCGGGTCQQDGPHRLGVAGQGRHLSRACACGSGVRSLAMGG